MVKIKSIIVVLLLFYFVTIFVTADAVPGPYYEVKILADLGIIDMGEEITSQHVEEEVDRLTAAISILKLQGRYHIAMAYHSTYTFTDSYTVPWAEGKNVLAYIKAKRMLSGNEAGEFMPFAKISEKEYYRLLLDTLGYKQTTDKVAGDYSWDNILEFAGRIGLRPVGTDRFTLEHMSKATVEAMKTKMKDGIVLVDYLVEEGIIDKVKAVSLGLYKDRIGKIKSAKAIGNRVVEVIYEGSNTKELILDISNYSIDGLEITEVVYVDPKTIHLKTSAQEKNNQYTLKVGENNINFKGIAKVNGQPYITSLKAESRNSLVVSFSRVLDFSTASNIKNYSINGVDIKNVKVNGNKVNLTTSELDINRNYSLKVSRIKSIDGISMEPESKRFSYYVDLVPPAVVKVEPETNQRIVVYFSEKIDTSSAEDINNYTIINGSGELKVLKAEVFGSKEDCVKLTTEPQKANSRYKLTVGNILDAAEIPNKMKSPKTIAFFGIKPDTLPPVFVRGESEILSKNQIRLVFKDESNIDESSILNINNYSITNKSNKNENIKITKAKKESYTSGKYKVLLTVDNLKPNNSYTIAVSGIKDEFENILDDDIITTLRMSGKLAAPAKIKSYNVINNNKVEFTFTKELEKASAEDLYNYLISDEIGNPYKASYRNCKLTLEMETLEDAKYYTLFVDGLEDIAGNVLEFSYKFKSNEVPPEVLYISQVDDRTFEMLFSEDVVDITQNGRIYINGKEFRINIDKNDRSFVVLTANSDIENYREYSFDISKVFADLNGIKAKNVNGNKTILNSDFTEHVDTDKPYIVNVAAISESIIEIEYNEDISAGGTYLIEFYNENDQLENLLIESYEIRGALVVIRLDKDSPLEGEYSYNLVIQTPAKDLAGNISSNSVGEVFTINILTDENLQNQ